MSFMKKLLALLVVIQCWSCGQEKEADPAILTDAKVIHNNVDELTQVIIYDVFSPPVASRIYAYTSLAAYEAIRHSEKGYPSIAAQMHGMAKMPDPEAGKEYNYLLASTRAFFTVAEKVTFSVDSLRKYYNPLLEQYKTLLQKDVYDRSIAFGEAIGNAVLERTRKDHYKETRGMPKFLGVNEPGKWRPTPPDYIDGAEPYWAQILPLTMDSAKHFPALPPPLYSEDTNSIFYKTVYEVYAIGKNLTPQQKEIAKYWDDNPAVNEHSGHLMFTTKKITPVGHWIGITSIASRMKNLSAIESAQAYVMTSAGIFDGFVACWEEKYKSQLVRPVTVINEKIDRNWQPLLQTPPFPEHTSGHSTISAAAAIILTRRFGDNFAFEDTSDFAYIGMKRKFSSFMQAAQEASISRLYGGIHYRTGVEEGTRQGMAIGEYINGRIRLREENPTALKR